MYCCDSLNRSSLLLPLCAPLVLHHFVLYCYPFVSNRLVCIVSSVSTRLVVSALALPAALLLVLNWLRSVNACSLTFTSVANVGLADIATADRRRLYCCESMMMGPNANVQSMGGAINGGSNQWGGQSMGGPINASSDSPPRDYRRRTNQWPANNRQRGLNDDLNNGSDEHRGIVILLIRKIKPKRRHVAVEEKRREEEAGIFPSHTPILQNWRKYTFHRSNI